MNGWVLLIASVVVGLPFAHYLGKGIARDDERANPPTPTHRLDGGEDYQ